jgi:Transposase IS66 family
MTEASGTGGTGPPIRLFGYSPSRSTQAARTLYEGMRPGGVLMSDGYEPYAAIAEQHRLVHPGCRVHCRRYFHEALQAHAQGHAWARTIAGALHRAARQVVQGRGRRSLIRSRHYAIV